MKVTTKQVLKYCMLPGIGPRIRELMSSGFGYISFFMAQIYHAARLLPQGHPYLMPANMGKFGVRHVIVEASSNLKYKRENIDQIILFFTLILGLVLLFIQFAILGGALLVQTAQAAGLPANFFNTPYPMNDIAFVLLDRVFGIPGIFVNSAGQGTCVAMGIPCFNNMAMQLNEFSVADPVIPWAYHSALHGMFQLYSIGLLVVAMVIFVYYALAILAETAQSGTPFGKRFNHVWAPLRMVVALGLLIPVGFGMNAAQYIALYAAKFGSGFATNGWILFSGQAVSSSMSLLGSPDTLIAAPKAPPLTTLLEFNTVLQTCKSAYARKDQDVKGYLIGDGRNPTPSKPLASTSYEDALKFYNYNDMVIRYGVHDPEAYSTEKGQVKQLCGEIIIQTVEQIAESISCSGGSDCNVSVRQTGAVAAHQKYYDLIKEMTESGSAATCTIGQPCTQAALEMDDWGDRIVSYTMDKETDATMPDNQEIAAVKESFRQFTNDMVKATVAAELAGMRFGLNSEIVQLGWGGAGIWYNKIAQSNGAIVSAVYNLPAAKSYPHLLEYNRDERLKQDSFVQQRDLFTPHMSDGLKITFPKTGDYEITQSMNAAYKLWDDSFEKPTGNIFVDTLKALFGLEGLLSIRDNVNIHPLAQLSAVGRSLVESSIRNLGYSMGAGVGGGIASLFGAHKMVGQVSNMAADFLFSIATMTLVVGFVLFYVVPLMPFLYFFFAVGNWVKGLFEAMVGVPLWALAHIRIDGQGLPGDAAMGGYFLILEIFLRPILIVFGLLAGIVIFAAQVRVLNEIFDLVTANVSGFSGASNEDPGVVIGILEDAGYKRDWVDQFFFTIIYTIIVYMIGTASFKLVDLIPNHILRWMGANVKSFGDEQADAAENLVRNTSIGMGDLVGKLGGIKDGTKGVINNLSERIGQKGSDA